VAVCAGGCFVSRETVAVEFHGHVAVSTLSYDFLDRKF